MPPANIDMQAIQQALSRRMGQAGGAPAGGNTIPAQAQQSQPGGLTPTGNPNVPGTPTPRPVPSSTMPTGLTNQSAQGQQVVPAAPKPNPTFDDETKSAGKVLITQLLKYL